MGLGGLLQELKNEGNLGVYLDYRSGRFYDWSGNGNVITLSNSHIFNKQGLVTLDTTIVTLPFSASWAWNTQVSVIYGYNAFKAPMLSANFNYASYHATPRAQAFRIGDNLVGWFDGVNLRIIAFNANAYRCLGISMSNNVAGVCYMNGSNGTALPGASIVEAPTVGNMLINYLPTDSWRAVSKYFVIVKRVLTASEHARLYGELENMKWETKGLTPGVMLP